MSTQNAQFAVIEAVIRTSLSNRSDGSWCATSDSSTPEPTAAFGYHASSRAGSIRRPVTRSEMAIATFSSGFIRRGSSISAMPSIMAWPTQPAHSQQR